MEHSYLQNIHVSDRIANDLLLEMWIDSGDKMYISIYLVTFYYAINATHRTVERY